MPVAKVFCTTREAASMLGVSLSTAQNWAASGLLEAWKTNGGHRRISRDSVIRLLAKNEKNKPEITGIPPLAGGLDARLRILVVEDDAILRRLYQVRLAEWSMAPSVETASNGFEALVKIGLNRPDLLISDLLMPHMDGFQMLKSLRLMADCASMKIVAVSGLDESAIKAAGGVPEDVEVLPKPVPFARLKAIAQGVLEQKSISLGAND